MVVADNTPSLCWGSLDGVEVLVFLRAAAGAGFSGVTLNTALYEDALATGLSAADLRALLDDLGLRVTDIDPHFNWLPDPVELPGDDVIARCTRATEREIFDLAHAVGTDLVNAPPGLALPESEQEIADAFGALCDRAAAEDLRVSLEFMPFT
ncbi:MAG: sugar phosphate isomerase/epimerase, partial [Halioglobus sp.]|nr:sugar phosphate isomerase/epimerase [Halioglobus sp.]